MRWWFRTSRHQVKIVVLAKFSKDAQRIVIKKWIGASQEVRTRGSGTTTFWTPERVQDITVTKPPGADRRDPAVYQVASGPLRFEFRLLFLRPPNAGYRDVEIGVEALEKVWTSLG